MSDFFLRHLLAPDLRPPEAGPPVQDPPPSDVRPHDVPGRALLDLLPHPAVHRAGKNGAARHAAARPVQHILRSAVRAFN